MAKLFYTKNIFSNRNTAKEIWYWWKTLSRIVHSIVSPDDYSLPTKIVHLSFHSLLHASEDALLTGKRIHSSCHALLSRGLPLRFLIPFIYTNSMTESLFAMRLKTFGPFLTIFCISHPSRHFLLV